MGSLTKALNTITGANEDEKAQKERLEILLIAAKAKVRSYRDEINEGFLNKAAIEKKQIPGMRAIRFLEQYHVASKQNFSEQANSHIKSVVDSFFSIGGEGDTKKAVQQGVQSLLSTALSGFIGSTEVGESEQKVYVVIPENNSFVRVDIACWRYAFNQTKLIQQSDTAVAYVMCKSVVDHSELKIDELIYLATDAISGTDFAPKDYSMVPKQLEKPLRSALQDDFDYSRDEARVITRELAKLESGSQSRMVLRYPDKRPDVQIQTNTELYNMIRDLCVNEEQKIAYQGEENGNSIWTCVNMYGSKKPANINVVEAYIDEMIKVWDKLKKSRETSHYSVS